MTIILEIPPPKSPIPRRAPNILLPEYRYVPKLHPHPLKNQNGHSFGKEGQHRYLSKNQRWDIGVDLFNNHYFWEAHEIWEGLWREAFGQERDFLQAMIFYSASLLQEHMGRRTNAEKSIQRAQQLITNSIKWSQKYNINLVDFQRSILTRKPEDNIPKLNTEQNALLNLSFHS